MNTNKTLSEVMNELKSRGYTYDFNLKPDCVECVALDLRWNPEHFTIDEFYRFEGMTNPDDSSILFAISSRDGIKGLLVDAYGVYAENLTDAMIQKLSIRRK